MILLIDIGNTNTVLGCVRNKQTVFTSRLSSDRNKTEDEYALLLLNLFSMHGVRCDEIEGGIISSVVPELKMVFSNTMRRLTGKNFLVVGSGLKTGLNIRIDAPDKLGSDLVVDAVAASAKYPKPTIIFDMGTATTLSVLDEKGHYIGGMIVPGMRVSVDALSARAAQLPYINLDTPSEVIGKNTVDCMQSGMVYGHAAMLDGLVTRVEEALGQRATTVITGGLARVVAPHCRCDIIYDENLLLDGLLILYEKNKAKKA